MAVYLPDLEQVAEKVHERWRASKIAQGVTSRPSPSGDEQMLPWADLTEKVKDTNRELVQTVYDAIAATDES